MFQEDDEDHWMVKTSAPVAFAVFPKEGWMPPRPWLEAMREIVQWTEMPARGHFDAFEQPGVDDRGPEKAVQGLPAAGVVPVGD